MSCRCINAGDRVFDTLGTRVSTETVRASARKIGLTATGLAVLVPIFVPTFSGTLFDGSGPGGDGDGDAVAIDNPMADLKRDLVRGRDVDVLDVYTVTGDPTYLRVSVLDSFDGETWKPSDREIPAEQRAEGRLPRPPGLSSGVTRREVTFQIRARDTFDGAVSELFGVLRQLALGDVGQIGRDLRSAGRHGAEREADRGAAQPRPP